MIAQTIKVAFESRLLAILFLLILSNSIQGQCGDPLSNFTLLGTLDNSSYYISNAPAQPIQAESIARSLDANLVAINSQEENDFVQSMIDEMVYIGLNDANAEGNMVWTNNDPITFSNYDDCNFCNTNDIDNDYVLIHPWNGGWSFMNRWSSRRYVIEKSCDDNGGGGNGGGNGNCNTDISGFDFLGAYGDSNYFLSTSPNTWNEAQKIAENLAGNLVTINSAAENQFLAGKFNEMVHIGLTDRYPTNEGNFSWADGTEVTYENYDDDCDFCEENDSENDFGIIHPWNAKWSLTNQWSQRNYIIEISCGNISYIDCPNFRRYVLTGSQTSTQVNWDTPSIVDNCAVGLNSNEQILGPSNGSVVEAGNYIIGYQATNDCGSEAYCEFDLEIQAGPLANQKILYANCPGGRTTTILPGESTRSVIWQTPFPINFCSSGLSSDSQIAGPISGSNLSAGNYLVRYRAVDNCGDSAICEFNVEVKAPINNNSTLTFMNCPSDRTVQIPSGESTAYVSWTPPSVTSSCNLGGLSLGLVSGPGNNTNLTAGSYAVQYRASNNCGDVEMCSFTINVIDGTNPSSLSINCPQNLNLSIPVGSNTTSLSFDTPSINNVCDVSGTTLVHTNGPGRNSQVGAGNYTISYRATNNCNDVATCSFNVNVEQENGSTITVDCPQGDQIFTVNNPPLPPVALWYFEQPTYDNTCTLTTANGSDGVSVTGPNPFNQGSNLSPGSFTATYTAYNLCGDTATCSWNVLVQPSSVPTTVSIDCPVPISVAASPGSNNAFVSWPDPNASTNCPSPGINITQIAGPQNNTNLAIGNYTVTYRAATSCGNQEECSFQVNVTANGNGGGGGNIDYTANDQVTPYTGLFRPGTNVGYNPPWTDEEMANLAAGNDQLGVKGIGARSMRPGLYDVITAVYGYDFRLETYEHYASLGLEDLTMIVGFPADWHRDQTDYCGNGFNSAMFRNLYSDIWDDGANGTPYNDDNYYAAYIYEVVSRYGPYVKFWEIWNEPGFDLTGNRGWRQPDDPAGNWWDNDPDPCEYILRAPIEHYVRTLRISWEIIKTLQPDDYVVVAGVGFTSFLDAILRNTDDPNTGGAVTAEHPFGGGAYFDVMGFHSYPDIDGSVYEYDFTTDTRVWKRHSDAAAQGIRGTKESYQDILDNYGYSSSPYPQKEWIITEINVPRKPFRADAMSGGEEMQVNYIIKAVAVAMQNDVNQMHVYNLGDRTTEGNAVTEFDLYGLHKRLTGTNAYTQVRNLEAIAYKSAADFVFGTTYDANKTNQMNLPFNLDGVALRMNNGRYKYIIWAKTTQDQSEFASGNYNFPANFGYNQLYKRTWDFTDTDQVQAISSTNINLTGRPIFITETPNANEIASRLNGEEKYHLSVHDILPNPAIDEISLVLEAKKADNYFIQIYDATGKLMEQRNTFLESGFSNEIFDISDYVHGMYFAVIQGASMRSTEVKFIKAEK